ncbi:MAG TPA: M14 family zinc carboxypeptidase [Longimicrobiales bacterium]|nr:M14 family zinc carboxypeptidase [Longimicrobiales bacterium]
MRRALPILVLFTAVAAPAAAQHALRAGGPYDPNVPTPQSVLGYEVGAHFTMHHMLIRYLDRLAATSPRIRLDTVAHTFEGREVMMVIATSEANQRRIDQIRADANRLADPRGASQSDLAAVVARMPSIVWLGFTVHGPEASGVEAAIALLYQLAAGQDAETRLILDSTVVLIDPVQNPDGHERHAQDVRRMRTAFGVPSHPSAMIHSGTWPGPRTSHYYFDLNRDWYALSHPETRGRVQSMLAWWPHVAADIHEMGSNSSYFFPPAMDPINQIVHRNILDWWDIVADEIIAAFDREGWSFFRREGYDEFYPGYGSSWPLYTGAVGMTFEQASSRGGAIQRSDGTVLTLREAAKHHYAAAWATALVTAKRRTQRVHDYLTYRQTAVTEPLTTPLRAIVLERDEQGRADSLARKLLDNGIEVGRLRGAATVRNATLYGDTRAAASVNVSAGSYVVDLAQPQGRLARALLEPDAPLDSAFIAEELERRRTGLSERFYDVTAWSLPFTFRVRAWGTNAAVGDTDRVTYALLDANAPALPPEARYGYAFAPGSESSIRLLAALLADSVRVWYAPRSFRAGAHDFPAGAFVVRAVGNRGDVHARVRAHAFAARAAVAPLSSSRADAGTDLGSNSVFPLEFPRIALLGGAPISGGSFGYAWYAFDQRLKFPVTPIDVSAAAGNALNDFNVLVIPSVSSGALQSALGDGGRTRMQSWVRAGGVVITLDAATEWLAAEATGLARVRVRRDSVRADSAGGAPLRGGVPGAILRAVGDTLSPLLAGIRPGELPVLVNGERVLNAPRNLRAGEVVLRFAPVERLRMAGYLWPEQPARFADSPYLWTESVGSGRVIGFAGDPNFRDLWRGLLPLFANAVFLGASY